ncbi:ABC transporter substrate-binding protein [Streptomyces himalayensis]|uniref:ABC transporter substrate-binding protein n=1 Tax=Streptomyces himalayensis subsp. himalayensis TaxID=2756131 RepID=A0A7W0DNE2_9ACTN|nr:ABC transporter substrate-binding protein [Streptomyces himalayensis]MBA2947910.1 ABC transporter substrate-binding protein [Streptomyces himalayensis subsp. himalayensis]
MIRRHGRFAHLAAACGTALLLLSTACGGAGSGTSSGSTATAGKPVSGGTARVLQLSEPRSLDPALTGNSWVTGGFVGNALYGTLMTNDTRTGKVQFKMAESFTTEDGGRTFELKLRDGLKFTDGTPLDAAAVKFNWDRTKDPATGSYTIQEASLMASTEVVDATTLKVTMVQPVANYAQAVLSTTLNWIASPKALKAGRQAFDAKPVGAGPYTLKKWTRQASIELAKNPDYYDAPKPYLDSLTIRPALDTKQRIDTMTSGGADVAIETNWKNIAQATDTGYPTVTAPLSGGMYMAMNARRAPFDDVRARKAVAAAFDFETMKQSVYNGEGKAADTLFEKTSPFYSDIKLTQTNRDAAQKLFDELAADGKPVSFTFKTFPSTENRAMAESLQTQLSRFKNVDVKVKVVDYADNLALHATHDFDMLVSSANFIDPESRLYSAFHGESRANMSGVDDEALNAALLKGRTATSTEERNAAYKTVQERLAELVPGIFIGRSAPSAVTGKNVHGIVLYGEGSLLPEQLWIQK